MTADVLLEFGLVQQDGAYASDVTANAAQWVLRTQHQLAGVGVPARNMAGASSGEAMQAANDIKQAEGLLSVVDFYFEFVKDLEVWFRDFIQLLRDRRVGPRFYMRFFGNKGEADVLVDFAFLKGHLENQFCTATEAWVELVLSGNTNSIEGQAGGGMLSGAHAAVLREAGSDVATAIQQTVEQVDLQGGGQDAQKRVARMNALLYQLQRAGLAV